MCRYMRGELRLMWYSSSKVYRMLDGGDFNDHDSDPGGKFTETNHTCSPSSPFSWFGVVQPQ